MARKPTIASEAKAEGEPFAKEKAEHENKARGGGVHSTHGGFRSASGGMEMNTEGPMPGHMADKHGGRARRKSGGGTDGSAPDNAEHGKVNVYNASGSPAMASAKDETPGFKKGGHKKRRDGGMAEGGMEAPRLDRRPRRAAGGGVHSPYSSASAFAPPTDNKAARGQEGVSIKGAS